MSLRPASAEQGGDAADGRASEREATRLSLRQVLELGQDTTGRYRKKKKSAWGDAQTRRTWAVSAHGIGVANREAGLEMVRNASRMLNPAKGGHIRAYDKAGDAREEARRLQRKALREDDVRSYSTQVGRERALTQERDFHHSRLQETMGVVDRGERLR